MPRVKQKVIDSYKPKKDLKEEKLKEERKQKTMSNTMKKNKDLEESKGLPEINTNNLSI